MTSTMERATRTDTALRPPRGRPGATPADLPPGAGRSRRTRALVITGLVLFFLYSVAPLWWVVVAATKNQSDLYTTNGLWFAENHLSDNFRELFTYNDGIFLRWLWNTVLYCVTGTLGMTVVCVAAGYGLAMYEFRGKSVLMGFVIGSFLVPGALLTIPSYLLLDDLGMINTPAAVIVPSFFSAFSVYLAKVYAEGAIPKELIEAARVDGAGEYRIFFRIGLRLMSTGVATVFLLGFVGAWNNFFGPLVFLRGEEKWTVMLGLYHWLSVKVESSTDLTGLVVAGSIVSMVPMVVLMISMQRYWRSGITLGSLK